MTKKSVYVQTGRMSRMTTSSASFSWARAAMRRACSSEVRVPSSPFGRAGVYPRSADVQPPRLDQARDRGRDELVDRLAGGHAGANLAGCVRERLDLEALDAVGSADGDGVAGARRHGEARQTQYLLRLLPARERSILVGPDHDDRIGEAALSEHVERPRVWVELDAEVRERRSGELEARLGRRRDVLVPGRGGDEHDRLAEALAHRLREYDVAVVRRIERAAEQHGQESSSSSSPTSTASPVFAPAARSAASSWSPSGALPVTRKPRSVRKIRYPRRAGGRGA